MNETISHYSIEVARSETESRFEYVPKFVKAVPIIDRDFAIYVGRERGQEKLKRVRLDRYDQARQEQFLAEVGLEYIREHNISSEADLEQMVSGSEPKLMDLFNLFRPENMSQRQQLALDENHRRKQRDQDILQTEKVLLSRRGIKVPNFVSLLDYCAWIPEATGVNPKVRQWGWDERHLHNGYDVYWDLMDHYDQIMRKVGKSLNPQQDWMDYLDGKLDLIDSDSWDLHNMGDEDVSYFSMSVRWGGGARTRPDRLDYPSRLLTHTTSWSSLKRIYKENYLNPRVCYSADRVIQVNVRNNPITLIFDRQELEAAYVLRPYTEPGGSHEHEIRSNETNHIGFCIGMVPTTTRLFPDIQGAEAGTVARGEAVITRWSQQYEATGNLWTTEQEALIEKEIIDYLA